MVIYEKNNKLYGTLDNTPSNIDLELEYKDNDNNKLELLANDIYLDNKSGGILRKSDNKTVNVFINGIQVVPYSIEETPIPPEFDNISEYLNAILIEDVDYEFADKYFKAGDYQLPENTRPALCTSVWKDGKLYRNFDWFYNYDSAFKVIVPAKDNDDYFVHGKRFQSSGVADFIPYLTSDFVKSGKYSVGYKLIPFRTVDGVNENHVGVSINVVPRQKGENLSIEPEIETKYEIQESAIPRFVLDNFESAAEAMEYIKNYVSIYPNKTLLDSGYDIHYIIGDKNQVFIAELINNKFIYSEIVENSTVKPIIANFHIFKNENAEFIDVDENGKVYTPATAKSGKLPSSQGITSHGSGLERYNIIVDNYSDLSNFRNLVLYNKAYTELENPWYSEFVGDYSNYGFELDLTVDNTPEEFESTVMPLVREMYENRSRDKADTWHTTHTSIYNLTDLTFSVYDSSEDNKEYRFNF